MALARGAESWWGCPGSDSGLLNDFDSGSDSDSDSDSDSAPLALAMQLGENVQQAEFLMLHC